MPIAHLYHKVVKKLVKPTAPSAFHPLPGMEDVLQGITNGLLVCDLEKKILLTNPALEGMIDLPSDKVAIPGFFKSFNCTRFDLEKKLDEVLSTGVTSHIEDLYLGKCIYEMFINPVRSFGGQISGAAIVLHDVTNIKEIDRVKTEFLSIAAHQLRTPLGSMRWNVELLLTGDVGEVSKEVKDVLMQVYQGTQRMIVLVGELLSVSRIEQSRVSDQPSNVNILSVVNDVIKELAFSSQEKAVGFELDIDSKHLPPLYLDSQRFRDVIQNLLSNAVKYNKPGKKVRVSAKHQGKEINMVVKDEGIGIPKKNQSQIFSKFFRADNAAKSQAEGNGLGLFIVKSYVESWGGKVWFESEEGKGTTFYLKLPEKPINHLLDQNLVKEKKSE